jgi:hypothetical protein
MASFLLLSSRMKNGFHNWKAMPTLKASPEGFMWNVPVCGTYSTPNMQTGKPPRYLDCGNFAWIVSTVFCSILIEILLRAIDQRKKYAFRCLDWCYFRHLWLKKRLQELYVEYIIVVALKARLIIERQTRESDKSRIKIWNTNPFITTSPKTSGNPAINLLNSQTI